LVYDLGLRLRDLRKNKHLSQTQVAKRLSLTRASISGYENNLASPSIDVLVKLALLYGVTTDYILGLDNRKVIVLDDISERDAEVITDIIGILLTDYKNRK
jgi:transcriptional regulator with XRE-family HTH domain